MREVFFYLSQYLQYSPAKAPLDIAGLGKRDEVGSSHVPMGTGNFKAWSSHF